MGSTRISTLHPAIVQLVIWRSASTNCSLPISTFEQPEDVVPYWKETKRKFRRKNKELLTIVIFFFHPGKRNFSFSDPDFCSQDPNNNTSLQLNPLQSRQIYHVTAPPWLSAPSSNTPSSLRSYTFHFFVRIHQATTLLSSPISVEKKKKRHHFSHIKRFVTRSLFILMG